MRRAFVLLVLSLTACEGSFFRVEDLGRQVDIRKSYEARDTCLKHNAADPSASLDTATLASTAALACQGETDRLIIAANPDRNSKVTASIRHDTEFRAMKYVLQARGQRAPGETVPEIIPPSIAAHSAD
jgi:hypothetical protein